MRLPGGIVDGVDQLAARYGVTRTYVFAWAAIRLLEADRLHFERDGRYADALEGIGELAGAHLDAARTALNEHYLSQEQENDAKVRDD